jgi:hypothetical protein
MLTTFLLPFEPTDPLLSCHGTGLPGKRRFCGCLIVLLHLLLNRRAFGLLAGTFSHIRFAVCLAERSTPFLGHHEDVVSACRSATWSFVRIRCLLSR